MLSEAAFYFNANLLIHREKKTQSKHVIQLEATFLRQTHVTHACQKHATDASHNNSQINHYQIEENPSFFPPVAQHASVDHDHAKAKNLRKNRSVAQHVFLIMIMESIHNFIGVTDESVDAVDW